MKKFLLFFVLSEFIFSQEVPDWYLKGELSGYPKTGNFIGVGVGVNFLDAQNSAQAAIAAQLQVSISSTIESETKSIDTKDNNQYQEIYKEKTKSTVDQAIKGIEVIKREKSGEKYYVFAVLNKLKYLNGLKIELDQLWSKLYSFVREARNLTSKGKIYAALANYTDAQTFIPEFYNKKFFYDALSSFQYNINDNITQGTILTEMRNLLSGIQIIVVSGDKQSNLSGLPLVDPIEFNVFYLNKNEKISIVGIPLNVEYENGQLIQKGVSDENGNFSCFAIAHYTDALKGKIIAKLNLVGIPIEYKEYLKNAETSATYSIVKTQPTKFTLKISDDKGYRLSKIETKLAKSIEKMGHYVGENSSLILDGIITTVDEKEISGMGSKQFLVTSELDLFLVVESTGEKVASLETAGKGLSVKNIEDAKENSYEKFKISNDDLSSMLSQADSKLQYIFKKKSLEFLKEGKKLYSQNKLNKAINSLIKVSHDEKQAKEALMLIKEIRYKINQIESEKLDSLEKTNKTIKW